MDVGMTASDEYKIGDEVWGATFPSSQGSHADFVTASTFTIAKVCFWNRHFLIVVILQASKVKKKKYQCKIILLPYFFFNQVFILKSE